MHPILQIFVSIVTAAGIYGIVQLGNFIYSELTSPFKNLPGPPNSSWIYGNSKEIQESDNSNVHEQWIQEYGNTITYKWFFKRRLFTTDPKALNHVLMNDLDYPKPEFMRWSIGRIIGTGVLVTEGDKHKFQRKLMNPAFSAAQVRELTEIFVEEAHHLKDKWSSQLASDEVKVDAMSWLSKMTLDVIGRAGFNYRFNALDAGTEEANELGKAFSTIFGSSTRFTLWSLLQVMIPPLRRFPSQYTSSVVNEAQATMKRIGKELVEDSKRGLAGTGEKGNNWVAKDLLSLLVRSNMSTDVPENQRMSEEDVIAQVPTFLIAGHETTSTATTWALYALTQHKSIQQKLREELLAVSTENPTMEILNSLPYLDAVVRETLRLFPPVIGTTRMAEKDDILPLSKPFTDRNGMVHHGLRIRKGENIFLSIAVLNRAKELWGEDAKEYIPERWQKELPSAVTSIPGVWGNMLTFLGGSHSCIGYRFSLVEMKALLFVLVRAFEFELAVPNEEIFGRTSIVRRPRVRNEPEKESQLPLLIKHYVQS